MAVNYTHSPPPPPTTYRVLHGLMNYKDTKLDVVFLLGLIEFIDWSQSVLVFSTQLCELLTFSLIHFTYPSPVHIYRECVAGMG